MCPRYKMLDTLHDSCLLSILVHFHKLLIYKIRYLWLTVESTVQPQGDSKANTSSGLTILATENEILYPLGFPAYKNHVNEMLQILLQATVISLSQKTYVLPFGIIFSLSMHFSKIHVVLFTSLYKEAQTFWSVGKVITCHVVLPVLCSCCGWILTLVQLGIFFCSHWCMETHDNETE